MEQLRRQHDAHRNCREDARTIQRNRRYYLRTHRSVYFENGKRWICGASDVREKVLNTTFALQLHLLIESNCPKVQQ